MKRLDEILHHEGVLILDSTDIAIAKRSARIWLRLFKEYLPPADVTEHAKGAHDAINDLENWIEAEDKQ